MARMTVSALALAAASALALAGPAGARTIDNWEIGPSLQSCTMISTFEDDVGIGLVWTPGSGELGFVTTLPRPSGLRGKAVTPVTLTFDGDAPYTEWEDQRATVVPGSDNDAVMATWGAEHSDELASAVKAASHVVVRIGERTIGRYDLKGSGAAYRELTHCGTQVAAR